MPTAIHSFSQEQVMAYLDGELSPQRTLAAAQHLEQCRECQRLAEDLQNVSRRLLDWQVEPVTNELPRLDTSASKKPKLVFWKRPVLLLVTTAAALLLLIVAIPWRLSRPARISVLANRLPRAPLAEQLASGRSTPQTMVKEPGSNGVLVGDEVHSFALAPTARPSPSPLTAAPPSPNAPATTPSGPLIVRTAELSVTSKNFDRDRADVERIAKTRGGYIAQLEFTTPTAAGRSLMVTIRVPAAQLDATLVDLKRAGHLDGESQSGEDVTQRYVDINARLSNLRTIEARLLQILRERTGRLADVLEVEEAVDRTRGEIEMTEAEKKMLSNQIAFASVHLKLSEEYKAPLQSNDTSVSTRLHNAAVDGYRNVVDLIVGALAFFLSTGPALLLLFAIAFFPARWLWWRWRGVDRRL